MNIEQEHHKNRAKANVALSSVIAAVFLTGMKLVVGIATGSLGILSEAAHSGLDLVAALMTFFAVKISGRPADDSHHYGHGKVEGLSALFEVLLLLITCGYIVYEAVARLTGKVVHVQVNVYSFAVIIISIVIDISRSTALRRAAKRYQSQALEADALHFSSDIWSSAVVIIGLICLKFLKFPIADTIAALVVTVIVIVVSIRLARRAIDVLLDKAPAGVRQKIEEVISQIPGVNRLDSLRIRAAGPQTFVDMRLLLAGELSFVRAHQIASLAEEKISALLPGADVVVHADPAKKSYPPLETKDQLSDLLKAHRGLFSRYHNLQIIHHEDSFVVSMHLVMAPDIHLDEAHKVCDHLERDIKQRLPGAKVTIHVEPYKRKR